VYLRILRAAVGVMRTINYIPVSVDHLPEKRMPVFRKEMRQVSNPERFPSTAYQVSWST
jgi:hypothetical protein